MKVAAVKPGGLDKIEIEDRADPVAGPGELLVRVRASSLNFHDFAVVAGLIPVAEGRVPMSDGAGEVVSVGEGVTGLMPLASMARIISSCSSFEPTVMPSIRRF